MADLPILSCWGAGRSATSFLGATVLSSHATLYPGNESWSYAKADGTWDEARSYAALAAHVRGSSNALGQPCAYVPLEMGMGLARLSVNVGSYGLRVGGNRLIQQTSPGAPGAYGEDTLG